MESIEKQIFVFLDVDMFQQNLNFEPKFHCKIYAYSSHFFRNKYCKVYMPATYDTEAITAENSMERHTHKTKPP